MLFVLALAFAALPSRLDMDFTAAPLAVALAYSRQFRRYLIPLATLILLFHHNFWIDFRTIGVVITQEGLSDRINVGLLYPGMLLPVFTGFALLLAFWPRLHRVAAFRRPTLCLLAATIAFVVVAQSSVCAGIPRVILWSLLLTAQPYLWFMAYALADIGTSSRQKPFWQHLGVFHPFWGSSMTPFGKGLAYLARFEASTPEELAVTQLKGVKLALWTLLLAACLSGFRQLAYGRLGIPPFQTAFLDFTAGVRDPRFLCWSSLGAFFVEDVLTMSVWGGAIVACARLAGFRLLRNTYRPLEARTLAEFWNRYYFYYKELLVDHFFYPVFLRCFRRHRRLRIFFATFMAACVGNLLFHFIRDIRFIAELGWRKAVVGEASHAFYTLLLATGVGLSQIRTRPRDTAELTVGRRALALSWVVLFFCLLHVYDAPLDRIHTFGQRTDFLFYLLGFDRWT